MRIRIYSGEIHERKRRWYLLVGGIYVAVLASAVYSANWFGVVLLIALLWGYIRYGYLWSRRFIEAAVTEHGLVVWGKLYPWHEIEYFALEMRMDKQQIHNLVLRIRGTHLVHTLTDDIDALEEFVRWLEQYVEWVDEIKYTHSERLLRKLQL